MKQKPIPNIKTKCRFCGVQTWAPADCKEPECEKCDELWAEAQDSSFEVEQTLEPITETARHLDYEYEDQLPATINQSEYDAWFAQSWIEDGVRVGPKVVAATAAA